jgi:general stress protein YciG
MMNQNHIEKAKQWETKLLEFVKSMKEDGFSDGETARLLEYVAGLCRPTYRLTREAAPSYAAIVPPTARAAVAEWMRSIAHKGGAATKGVSTKRKADSSRENGKKGGRPRKNPINKEEMNMKILQHDEGETNGK